jgi:hypothetical protein
MIGTLSGHFRDTCVYCGAGRGCFFLLSSICSGSLSDIRGTVAPSRQEAHMLSRHFLSPSRDGPTIQADVFPFLTCASSLARWGEGEGDGGRGWCSFSGLSKSPRRAAHVNILSEKYLIKKLNIL